LVREGLLSTTSVPSLPSKRALALAQHSLTASFMPACDCWRLEVSATQALVNGLLQAPNFRVNLTVSRFGSIGTP
jgi:hypothetical protein